ncbi:MAG: NAD(P)H-dependent oxidoreductase [Candidatus Omnitrophota bacterium]
MNHLIIYCHPNPKSFNHAVLESYEGLAKDKGHDVRVRDIYSAGFDPVLKAEDFIKIQQGSVSEDVKEEQEQIKWADIITFIHPIWWFQMPAMLKGYIDRVFSYGFAYKIDEGGIKGLLSGKKVIILNTTGGSEEVYNGMGFRNAVEKTIDEGVFGVCGMEVAVHGFFYAVPFLTEEDRKGMLEHLKEFEF